MKENSISPAPRQASVTTKQLGHDLQQAFPAFLTKESATTLTRTLTALIAKRLAEGNIVELEGVGRLLPKMGLPRKGYSPATKRTFVTPARKRVRFSVYPALDKALNP